MGSIPIRGNVLYFYFFALVLMQSAVLIFHHLKHVLLEFGRKWEKEVSLCSQVPEAKKNYITVSCIYVQVPIEEYLLLYIL